MKAKNQQPLTSETDAREKLIVYVYEYLVHSGARQAADIFKENVEYTKEIKINDGPGPGFLHDWWCVFWDLYCAAPGRNNHGQPEPSSDARVFMDHMRPKPMSPSIAQPSPPQHPQQMPGPPQFIGGPRYGPPVPHPSGAQPRGPMPRMQGPMPHHGPPYGSGVPPPPNNFMSPGGQQRYAHQHPGPPQPPQQQQQQQPPPPPQPQPQQPHINQGMMFGPTDHQMGPSPGLNRMTPVGEPPQGVVVQSTQIVGMSPAQQIGTPGPPQSQINPMQGNGPPPRDGSQGSGNVNYSTVNSPAHGPCYSGSGEPQTPHPVEEYVMPVPSFGQEPSDQSESAEILKIKQSMQDDTTKMFEKEQSDYSLDYQDSQGKWS